MAFRYLVDGYNLLYALHQIPAGAWHEKRERLLSFLLDRRPHGKNPLTIVFDSRQGAGSSSQTRDITVVFTAGETADDWIGEQVRKVANPRTLVVVSNDKGVRRLVSGTGARYETIEEFLKVSKPRPARTVTRDRGRLSNPDDITNELKEKWL